MFEQQQFVIKSGEGKNYFEATAHYDNMASPLQIREIMDGLRKLQKDRMEWAASGKVSA
jgi:hypothetical protein